MTDFILGDWNATCSMCGGKFKASQLKKHWQGFWRCQKCWNPRHPQDFVRAVKDVQTVPFDQPWLDNDIQICTVNGNSAYPGAAIPDCSIPEQTLGFDPAISPGD